MKNYLHISHKTYTLEALQHEILRQRLRGAKIAFTNGCFDILHRGHIDTLTKAASFGDILIVGVNSDASTKRLKGPERPVNNEADRSYLLASLEVVDATIVFQEDTPLELIKALKPDILIKGGDYTLDKIVGAQEVLDWGGAVQIVPYEQGYSTTGLIQKIQRL
jgi:rfaE bifunctional protein nucleotidyltransferase chain/domain